MSFLESRDEVDHEDIGALGICASGGYVPFAAQTDLRIKAVATVSGADMGDLFRKGLNTSIAPNLDHLLEESNKARTEEAQGRPPRLEHIVHNTPEEIPRIHHLAAYIEKGLIITGRHGVNTLIRKTGFC